MIKKISTNPFKGTPEQEAELKKVIEKHLDDPGAVMPVLQEAQDIYGYLPIEVQKIRSRKFTVLLLSTASFHCRPRVSTQSAYVSEQPAMLKALKRLWTPFPNNSVSAQKNVSQTVSFHFPLAVA